MKVQRTIDHSFAWDGKQKENVVYVRIRTEYQTSKIRLKIDEC